MCFYLCYADRASRYICVIRTNSMQYLSSIYCVNQHTTCFWHICSPSSGGVLYTRVAPKIFRTDAVKIVKLTIGPIGRRYTRSFHPPTCRHRSHRLLHFWNSSWKSFSVRVSSTLCDSVWISSMVLNQRPFSFNFIFGNRKKSVCQIRVVRWVGV